MGMPGQGIPPQHAQQGALRVAQPDLVNSHRQTALAGH
jgi:hypothetical protein